MRALVTGGTGLIGSQLVLALLRRGDAVRVLARCAERSAPLASAGAEVVMGDLAAPMSLAALTEGVEVVFHLASAMRAPDAIFRQVDGAGTDWLIARAEASGVRRLVYAGTLSGFDLVHVPHGAALDEDSPLDPRSRMGAYARAKSSAEQAVLAAHRRGRIQGVIVRLGLVCGATASSFPAHVGRFVKPHTVVVFGDGGVPLPLLYIDNAVEALLLAGSVPEAAGETFNVVDEPMLTQREYLTLYQQAAGTRLRVLKLPRLAYYALGAAVQLAARARGKEPETTVYRVRARLRHVRWNCAKAQRILNWRTRVPLAEGLGESFRGNRDHRSAALDTAAPRTV